MSEPKKRGRPKKNNIFNKTEKKHSEAAIDNNENEEIVLYLPIQVEDESSEKNVFTIKEDEFLSPKSLINSISMESDSPEDIDTNRLYEEIKKKNEIIKQLKCKLSSADNQESITISKKTKNMPRNLVDIKDEKHICRDETNVACWWCTYNFLTVPCFLPEQIIDDKYYVFGCFCSLNCAVAYNYNQDDYKTQKRHSLLIRMYRSIIHGADVNAAPNWKTLQKFGGDLTIDEFRSSVITFSKKNKKNLPSIIYGDQ